jgi:hypothetical protein
MSVLINLIKATSLRNARIHPQTPHNGNKWDLKVIILSQKEDIAFSSFVYPLCVFIRLLLENSNASNGGRSITAISLKSQKAG